jgi:hypothetical protein
MSADLGDDVEGALREMTRTIEALPGTFKPQFILEYWAGVIPPAEFWCCTVEGDLTGDGGRFFVLATSAAEALRQAARETWRRVPPRKDPPT